MCNWPCFIAAISSPSFLRVAINPYARVRAEDELLKTYFVVAALLAMPLPLFAADTPISDTDDNNAAEVVVTATRRAETADETLAPVTIITAREIEATQASDLKDLLEGRLGISVTNNGGPGKQSSVFMRGTNSNHILVIVDGLRIGSATSGDTPWAHIPLDQIKRIEIVRGPRSSLYGSEAIGGVIQIITKKGGGKERTTAYVGSGSYATHKTEIGLMGGGDHLWYSLGLSSLGSEGIDACREPGTAGCGSVAFPNSEPDKDGYVRHSTALRTGYRFVGGGEVDLRFKRIEAFSEFDGGFQNESKTVQQLIGAGFKFSLGEKWQVALDTGRSWDLSDYFLNGLFVTRFDTVRDSFSLKSEIETGGSGALVFGFDYLLDKVNSTTAYTVSSRANVGFFAQYQIALGRHKFELSARRDDNGQFGQHYTGGVAWGYGISGKTRLIASLGSAFKAPTFNELYWPADPIWGGGGNPNLLPETSKSMELELKSKRWSLGAFRTDVSNLIAGWPTANINLAQIYGVEASAQYRFVGWDAKSTLTLIDPRDVVTGNLLARRAQASIRIDANRELGQWRLGLRLLAVGSRFDNQGNTIVLDPYATLDVQLMRNLGANFRFETRINNLLDAQYETAYFYNQPGRNFFIGLRYQPGAK